MPPTPDQLADEFVTGGSPDFVMAAYAAVRAVSPRYIDDVTTGQLPSDVYERMLRETSVASAYDTYKLATLSGGYRVAPAVAMPPAARRADRPEEVAAADRAEELAQFVRRSVEASIPTFRESLKALLDGAAFGSKVLEVVLKPGEGEDAGRWVLDGLRPKSAGRLAYVLDDKDRLLGVLPVNTGTSATIGMTFASEAEVTEMLPPEKFVIYSRDPRDGDPRGRSVLRPAYTPWFMLTQVVPEFFKYLGKFSSPQVIGKCSPNENGEVPQYDADGTPMTDSSGAPKMTSAQRRLLGQLLGWKNAWALAVPAGTEVEMLEAKSNGEAFRHALDYFKREIHEAILGTAQATTEAKHESRSSKDIGQDILGLRVSDQRQAIEEVVGGFFRLLVELNFGPDDAKLAPYLSLGSVEQQDKWKGLQAVADAYAKGYVHDSQLPELDAELGLPERDMEAIAADKAERALREQAQAEEARRLFTPAG
ncbi:MAG: DUF935 family protein [Fimbriimonadaceae bacterium]|nr:DUF935 family protein [Fimbriimonadaceae bacterium]QYK56655.1 MAG: DUF935 family protein [Fimbriimonadaceae bacterium]